MKIIYRSKPKAIDKIWINKETEGTRQRKSMKRRHYEERRENYVGKSGSLAWRYFALTEEKRVKIAQNHVT